MLRTLALSLIIASGIVASSAMTNAQQPDELKSIISRQIEAFRNDDGVTAFGFASLRLRAIFQSPDRFMDMVRRQYEPVYRPETFQFGQTSLETAGRPVQIVDIVDQRGRLWRALYAFVKHPDGTWRIAGVQLQQVPGDNV